MLRRIGWCVSLMFAGACIDFDTAQARFCRDMNIDCFGDGGVVVDGGSSGLDGGMDAGTTGRFSVTFSVVVAPGTVGGAIQLGDGGLLCDAGQCVASFNGPVGVRAVANRWGWVRTLSCNDAGVTCTLSARDDGRTISATFGQPNVVFVSEPITIDALNQRAGSNAFERATGYCREQARDSFLPDSDDYLPWLGLRLPDGGVVKTIELIEDAGARGWVRVDGRPSFDRLRDPLNGVIMAPWYSPNLDARARTQVLSSYTRTWSGLDELLRLDSDRCNEFTADAGAAAWTLLESSRPSWASNSDRSATCALAAPFLCFGTRRAERLEVRREPHRLMFVTQRAFRVQPDGGLTTADQFCDQEAALLSLPDAGYVAYLSAADAGPGARLSPGLPWATEDGLELFPDSMFLERASFAPGGIRPLTAPVVVRTPARRDSVFVGVPDLVGTDGGWQPGLHCNGWSSTAGVSRAGSTLGAAYNFWDTSTLDVTCASTELGLYCFQR